MLTPNNISGHTISTLLVDSMAKPSQQINVGFQPYNNLPNSSLDVIGQIQDKNLQNEYLFNYYGVRDQQAFAERMARNSYQYAIEDLRKAGLNPYMLYSNGGSGATTPSTSAYSASPYASAKYSADTSYKSQLTSGILGLVGSALKAAALMS